VRTSGLAAGIFLPTPATQTINLLRPYIEQSSHNTTACIHVLMQHCTDAQCLQRCLSTGPSVASTTAIKPQNIHNIRPDSSSFQTASISAMLLLSPPLLVCVLDEWTAELHAFWQSSSESRARLHICSSCQLREQSVGNPFHTQQSTSFNLAAINSRDRPSFTLYEKESMPLLGEAGSDMSDLHMVSNEP
jgi:hypothetical protein